ncbi:MAG TPA: glycosyltransferase family 4 protein [Steroidobacteraceae bacterium]
MRILVLTFYYRPDLCAGSFRMTPFVAALRERIPAGTQIDVVTTLPNRYSTFSQDAAEIETEDGLEVRRIRLPSHRSDMSNQARAFLYFARRALAVTRSRKYDLVFATSSRLMTAALGAYIARRQRAPLYLDLRDIFVDTIRDVLPQPAAWPLSHCFSLVESWAVKRADRINLVSRGFENYFRTRYGERPFSWFTNGIDDEFLDVVPAGARRARAGPATILYAGNIGEGQQLHEILPALAGELRTRARFVVIGDGGRRDALVAALAGAGIDNVELRSPINRRALLEAYREADVLFLHLGAYAAFEKVLPSKLFEYGALGKPVLAGVAGYAAKFVREEINNAAVFMPCDARGAVAAFDSLQLVSAARPDFVAKFARANIVRAMADDVLELLPQA